MPQVTFTFTAEGQDKIIKGYAQIGSAADKAAKQEAKAAQKAAKEREKALKHVAKVKDNYFRDQQRQEDRANAKALKEYEKALKKRQKLDEKYKENVKKQRAELLNGVGTAAVNGIAAVGKIALTGAGVAAGFVGAAARDALGNQEAANRLAINGRLHGQQFADTGELQDFAYGIAKNNKGTKAGDVLNAGLGFVGKTGDLDSYKRFADTFAKVAQASGASLEDVSNAGAEIFQKFDIKSAKDMQGALAQIYSQGKEGAYELKDLASNLGKAGAAYTSFAGKGAKLGELGGFLQIARTATGGPEEATTAAEDVFGMLKTHQKQLKAAGINIYDKQGNTKDINQLLVELVGAKGHNFAAKDAVLGKILGREGIRAVNPLITTYKNTYQDTKGTEKEREAAASKAVAEQLEAADNAAGEWKDVVTDAAKAQEDTSAQLEAAWQELESEVSSNLLPALQDMLPDLLSLAHDAIPPTVKAFEVLVKIMADLAAVIEKIPGMKPTEGNREDNFKKQKDAFAEQKASLDEQIAEARKNKAPPETIKALEQQRDTAEQNRKHAASLEHAASQESTADYANRAIKGGIYGAIGGVFGLGSEKIFDTLNPNANKLSSGLAGYGDALKAQIDSITKGAGNNGASDLKGAANAQKQGAAATLDAANALKGVSASLTAAIPILGRK